MTRLYRLDIGRVLGESFGIFVRNAYPFLVFALLVHLPLALYTIVVQHDIWQARQDTGPFTSGPPASLQGLVVVQWLGSPFAQLLLQIVIASGVYAALSGRRASLGASLAGLRRFFPALGVSIMVIILTYLSFLPAILVTALAATSLAEGAIMLGLALMLGAAVVAIIVLCTYYVPVQATIVERTGVFKSLGRSGFLTRGSRWRILALILIVGLAGGFLKFAATGVLLASARSWGMQLTGHLVNYAITAVTVTFQAIMAAVVYYELRRGKEGVDIAAIVKVFE